MPRSPSRSALWSPPIVATLAVGMLRPFRVTRVNPLPKPRMVTREPSPFTRSMETPVIRWRDSARLVSGKLPMSSAEMASTTPWESRLMSIARCSEPRTPVTVMTSWSAVASWARTGAETPIAMLDAPVRSASRPKWPTCDASTRLSEKFFTVSSPSRTLPGPYQQKPPLPDQCRSPGLAGSASLTARMHLSRNRETVLAPRWTQLRHLS